MEKRIVVLMAVLALFCAGCGAVSHMDESESLHCISNTVSQDCYLCGDRDDTPLSKYWGQENVGIVSLSTFEVSPLEINCYDSEGELLEEKVGYVLWQTFAPGEDTFSGTMMVEMDRGYANGSLQLCGDKARDMERLASFLCQDCLDSALASILGEGYDAGIVNFKTRELRVLEKNIYGVTLGDFY